MATLPPYEPVSPAETSRRPLLLIIIGALVGVILIGAGSAALAFNLLSQRPNGIPQLLAADTEIYAAVTPNLADLPNIERLRRAFPEAVDYQSDAATGDGLREMLGVGVQEDITPWLGVEVAVAVSELPFDELPAIGADPAELAELPPVKMAVILASRDAARAQAFLDKQRAYREGKGEQFTTSTAGGVTIYAQQGGEPSPIAAFALVRDYVVFASDPALIAGMAERDRDGPDTLQASPDFQAVLAGMPADRMGFAYVAGKPIANILRNGSEQAAQANPAGRAQLEQAVEMTGAMHGVGFSLAVVEAGLRFDAVGSFDRAALSAESLATISGNAQPVAAERAGQVSGAAIGIMSMRIPESLGESVSQAIRSLPDGEAQLEQYQQALGLDLEEDFFAWFHGEAVLALFPGTNDAPVAGYFALAPADLGAAQRGVERIVGALDGAAGGTLGLADTQVGGASFQAVQTAQGLAGYGFVGDDLVIGFGEAAMAAAAGEGDDLAGNPAYQAGVAALPSPNTGTMFIDVAALVALVREQGDLDAAVVERLEPFRALVAAGSPGLDERGVSRMSALLVIGD